MLLYACGVVFIVYAKGNEKVFVFVYRYIYVCMYKCMYLCMHVCVCVCLCTYTYISSYASMPWAIFSSLAASF
jgi:hypothetical protein